MDCFSMEVLIQRVLAASVHLPYTSHHGESHTLEENPGKAP